MDEEFTCNRSEGSPQQNIVWWIQPNTPLMRYSEFDLDH